MVDALAAERGYKNRDEVTVSPATMGDAYESKVKMFFAEHLHEDEEIRYIRDGEGYFDVRDREDEWVRIRLAKDDLIVLPAGIYHRFTTDDKNVSLSFFLFFLFVLFFPFSGFGCLILDWLLIFVQYVKAMRLFQEEPKWTPLNRSGAVDVNPHRKTYVDSLGSAPVAAAQ